MGHLGVTESQEPEKRGCYRSNLTYFILFHMSSSHCLRFNCNPANRGRENLFVAESQRHKLDKLATSRQRSSRESEIGDDPGTWYT